MKVKPYRACDICGQTYDKVNDCMRVKILHTAYDDLRIMEKMDICPECARKMLEWVKNEGLNNETN